MNDIIPAKNYSLHKHRFYTIQKKLNIKIYISANYENVSK